jgi:hypothetical protein
MTYWFYRGVAFLIRLLPLPVAYWLGLRICDLFYFLNRRGRAAVRENLDIVFAHQGIVPRTACSTAAPARPSSTSANTSPTSSATASSRPRASASGSASRAPSISTPSDFEARRDSS